MKTSNYYLASFIVLCIVDAAYEGVFYWHDGDPAGFLSSAGWSWSLLMLTLWVDADSKEPGRTVYRPYEFGFLVFMYWLPYLPYYFWRTRGAIGLAMFGGVAGLLSLGYIAQWLIFLVHYSGS